MKGFFKYNIRFLTKNLKKIVKQLNNNKQCIRFKKKSRKLEKSLFKVKKR